MKKDDRLRLMIIVVLTLPLSFFFFGFKPHIFLIWFIAFLTSVPFDLWWFGKIDKLRQDVLRK